MVMVMATATVMVTAMAMVTAMVWKKKNNRGTNECLDSGRNKKKANSKKKNQLDESWFFFVSSFRF